MINYKDYLKLLLKSKLNRISFKKEFKYLIYRLKFFLGLKYWKGDTLKTKYYNNLAEQILNAN